MPWPPSLGGAILPSHLTLPTTPPLICLLNHLPNKPPFPQVLFWGFALGKANYNTFDPSNWITDVINIGLTSSHLSKFSNMLITQFWLFLKFVLEILGTSRFGDRDCRALRKLFLTRAEMFRTEEKILSFNKTLIRSLGNCFYSNTQLCNILLFFKPIASTRD